MSRSSSSLARWRPPADERSRMAAELRRSLTAPLPSLPSKYFYDARGSALFEEITRLPEYYLTRTELGILEQVADGLVAAVPRAQELIEIGSGTGRKLRLLLDALQRTGGLRLVTLLDIDEATLAASVRTLESAYPGVRARGVVADFMEDLEAVGSGGDRLVAFLGSTIGNVHPGDVPGLLGRVRASLGPAGAFVLGVDLVKERRRLEAAYNDAAGVTAAFNLNILQVVNDRLGADFDLADFEHRAFFDRERSWIEMRLRCRRAVEVRIPAADLCLRLREGDEIRTEISCKYTREGLEGMASTAGLAVRQWHTDSQAQFAVALLQPIPRPAREPHI